MSIKILVLEDNSALCEKINILLRNNGYITASTCEYNEARKLMKATPFDLVIADCHLNGVDPFKLISEIKKHNSAAQLIFTGSESDMHLSIELMHKGAYYFLTKPLNPEILLEKTSAALSANTSCATKITNASAKLPYSYIKGNSKEAQLLSEEIKLVAPTDYSVIIEGETGTGKESIARLLHEHSKRSDKPFVPIDCGSLTKELAASELFGHEKGAFTGALNDKSGAFQLADGGTLFLDEIGNLPYEVQIYLLRSIQEGIIRKVGSSKEIPVNVRLLVATNDNLLKAIQEKRFREDLYHRLNEFKITIPPLRERKDDLSVFITSFIKEASERLEKNIDGIDENAMELLLDYSWPGNVRELKNVIKNACLRASDGRKITKQFFPPDLLKAQHWQGKKVLPSTTVAPDIAIKETVRITERVTILKVLESVNFNKTRAAQILKIDRKTLYNKLKDIDQDL